MNLVNCRQRVKRRMKSRGKSITSKVSPKPLVSVAALLNRSSRHVSRRQRLNSWSLRNLATPGRALIRGDAFGGTEWITVMRGFRRGGICPRDGIVESSRFRAHHRCAWSRPPACSQRSGRWIFKLIKFNVLTRIPPFNQNTLRAVGDAVCARAKCMDLVRSLLATRSCGENGPAGP